MFNWQNKGRKMEYIDLPMIAPNSEQTQGNRPFKVEHLIIRNFTKSYGYEERKGDFR